MTGRGSRRVNKWAWLALKTKKNVRTMSMENPMSTIRLMTKSGVMYAPSSRKATSTGVTTAVKRRKATIVISHRGINFERRVSITQPRLCIS